MLIPILDIPGCTVFLIIIVNIVPQQIYLCFQPMIEIFIIILCHYDYIKIMNNKCRYKIFLVFLVTTVITNSWCVLGIVIF